MKAAGGGNRPAATRLAAAQGGGLAGVERNRVGVLDSTHGLHQSIERDATKLGKAQKSTKTTVHGLKGRTTVVKKLRRDRSRAGEGSDANTQHRWLPLVQVVLQSNFSATERLQRPWSMAAALG
jgi:hypothetical protein